jgi:nucleoid-associated protein YejK
MKLESTRQDLKQLLDFLTDTAKQSEFYLVYCGGKVETYVDVFFDETEAKDVVDKLNKNVGAIDGVDYNYKAIVLNKRIW